MTLSVHHRIGRDDVALGLVVVEGVTTGPAPAALAEELDHLLARYLATPSSAAQEQMVRASRDILRNGRYKPTGRGKPASEYLARAAREGSFPRINGPVDANNLVSLAHGVAISLWDLDLAPSAEVEFRLGRAGESYVFNAGGQTLDLEDLVCGAALHGGNSTPMLTPIKDSLATKLKPDSHRVAGCIYYPLDAGSAHALTQIRDELLRWLTSCGPTAAGGGTVLLPGASASL